MSSYGVDTNWYIDSGSTDHITNALENLTTHEQYTGHDQIHEANGKGMNISHIGNSIIHTPKRNFSFNNVLHVPSASKNLVSVHKFTTDNNVFLEFHPTFFCVKDLDTKTLLRGSCCDGLYPMPPVPFEVHHIVRPSILWWHHRLGHPSSVVVEKVLKDNHVSFSRESSHLVQDKSHRLTYPISTSVSSSPLELIFSDV